MSKPIRVALVLTAPAGQHGSMARYADLVAHAFSVERGSAAVEITRINLAMAGAQLERVPTVCRNWVHHAWIMLSARTKLHRCSADLFHIIDGSHAYVAKLVPGQAMVATSHDVIPLLQARGRLDGSYPRGFGRWLIRQSIEGLRTVKHVIAVSANTQKDLCRFGNLDVTRISVVHSAVPPAFFARDNGISLPSWSDRRGSEEAYVLHVGNDAFYKNRAGVLRIFARILTSCDVRLKLAGPPPDRELSGIISALGLDGRVEFVVNPDDDRLKELYRRACVFLFPSIYEGFGWPPLEAMAFGCPVVCSSAASLPEVVGDAALTCPAEDEEQMARNCIAVLQDSSVAKRLAELGHARAREFSVERMAKELLDVYTKCVFL